MEYVTTCDICNTEYNENVVIPKILPCGHTFCLPCLNRLIEVKTHCPTCRMPMNVNKRGKDYPTNYYVFNALIFAQKEDGNQMVSSRIRALKNKFAFRKTEIYIELMEIDDHITKLESLIEKKNGKRNRDDNQIVDLDNAKNVLDTLENRYKKRMRISGLSILIESTDISRSSYEDTDEYLLEIYNRLQKNEVIYAVKNIDDVVKYGKVSFQDNLLLFHALTEDEKPDNSSIIWFDDLKQCVSEDNFFSFLKISCNENGIVRLVTISMLNNRLASTFISLCTGECGEWYKGYHLEIYMDININISELFKVEIFSNSDKRIDYNTETKNNTMFIKGELIVTVNEIGDMHVCRLLNNAVITNAVGTVESPNDLEKCISFKDASKLIVSDSGILIKL